MLHDAHRCEPPYDANAGSRWQCDCGQKWRCTDSPARFDGSDRIAFGARRNRGWWDLGSVRGSS